MSFSLAQTSGGGPTTHSSTLSVTDGTIVGYPYQIGVSPGSLSCTNGVCTITTGGGGGSGTVNSGTQGQNAFYATSGTAVSGTSALIINGSNVGVDTTLPIDYFTSTTPNSGGISVNANPTPNGIDSNTYTLLHLNNNVTDSAPTPFTYTNSGVTFSNVNPEFAGVSYGVFNGSASLHTGTNFSVFNGTNPWTIDFWIEPSNTTGASRIIDISSDGDSTNIIRALAIGSTPFSGHALTNVIYFNCFSTSEILTITAPWTPSSSSWQHIVIQRINSGNTSASWGIYVGGVSQTLTLVAGSYNASLPNLSSPAYIGSDSITSNFFTGNLGEFRVSNIARYASNFTPNTFPYNTGIGTPAFSLYNNNSLLTKFWNDGFNGNATKIDVNGNTVETLTTVGNVGIGSIVPGTQLDVDGSIRIIGTSGSRSFDVEGTLSPIFFAGNVGINSVAPGANLDITGGARVSTGFATGSNTVVSGFVNSGGYDLSNNSLFSLGSGIMQVGQSVNITQVQIGLANVGKDIFAKSGNLGINTLLPVGTLDVQGTLTPNHFIVDGNGNVGVGSFTPGSPLDVQGTVRALSSGTCTTLYKCQGGVDVGVIQTSACALCPASTCVAMNGCF